MDEKVKQKASQVLLSTVQQLHELALVKEHITADGESVQLPLWPSDMRAMPNDYARSALFTVRNKKAPRRQLMDEELYHLSNDVTLTYSGIELRADDDELVWLQVIEFAKAFPLGKPVQFTMYQLCQAVGWPRNGTYYRKAEACLTRLQATALKIRSKRLGHVQAISMIRSFTILSQGTRVARCQVVIEEKMIVMFSGNHFTQFLWAKYRSLKPIARRLYDYIGSHKAPFPLKLAAFNKVCGSDCERPNKWAEMVRKACDELVTAGMVESAWVEKDTVKLIR